MSHAQAGSCKDREWLQAFGSGSSREVGDIMGDSEWRNSTFVGADAIRLWK